MTVEPADLVGNMQKKKRLPATWLQLPVTPGPLNNDNYNNSNSNAKLVSHFPVTEKKKRRHTSAASVCIY